MKQTLAPQWRLPGHLSDYVILRGQGGANLRPTEQVPGVFVAALLDRWASSGAAQVLHDIYKAIGGSLPAGLTTSARAWHDQQLKQRLRTAFLRGELVALPVKQRAYRSLPPPLQVPRRPPPERSPEPELTFIAIQLVDETGKPVPRLRYRVETPDGRSREGTLNARGEAREDGLPPGQCRVTFPDLDAKDWQADSAQSA